MVFSLVYSIGHTGEFGKMFVRRFHRSGAHSRTTMSIVRGSSLSPGERAFPCMWPVHHLSLGATGLSPVGKRAYSPVVPSMKTLLRVVHRYIFERSFQMHFYRYSQLFARKYSYLWLTYVAPVCGVSFLA